MLIEHRIDDVNERFVAVKQPVPSGEQIPLQPSLALVLAEHRVQYASGGREKFIILYCPGFPLTVGFFKNRAKKFDSVSSGRRSGNF